ncbi:MAG: GNAT family N-acetyltransferase [Parachlamydia sp.]|nr:GNAT family N-acetyltransferase [Parachlamydia sp.]
MSAITVERVNEANSNEVIPYLKKHENSSLFLLGNAEQYGWNLVDSPYSGNYKLMRKGGKIAGVFCLYRSGSLMVQSEERCFDLILDACREEHIPIKGCLGEWEYSFSLWSHLQNKKWIAAETYRSKEVLYTLELAGWQAIESPARLLQEADYPLWKVLRKAYIKEMQFPTDLTEEQMRRLFLSKVQAKTVWGLFSDGKLAAIADLNAKALDLGQVGGVYTDPAFRKKGMAKTLMQRLVTDAKKIHSIRKLIIFTDENNVAALRLYRSLGANEVGHFALLFGS